jgi:hypothetical protein
VIMCALHGVMSIEADSSTTWLRRGRQTKCSQESIRHLAASQTDTVTDIPHIRTKQTKLALLVGLGRMTSVSELVEMIPNIESKAAKLLGRGRSRNWGGKPKSAGKHGLGDKDLPQG